MKICLVFLLALLTTSTYASQEQAQLKNQFCQNVAAFGQNTLGQMLAKTLTLDQAIQANQEAKDEHQIEHIYVFMSHMLIDASQVAQLSNQVQQQVQIEDFYRKYYNICRHQFIDATTDVR